MSEIKIVAASIVNFLRQQLEGDSLNSDSKESIEVGVQCIETGFELSQEELSKGVDLLQLIRQQGGTDTVDRDEAEKLKNEGNDCMKADKFREAFDKYTKAIKIDPRNAVYYCNRAAAHFKMGEHEAAIADCMEALVLQPDYGKAHGRLGLALAALDRNIEARASFERAAQLDPDNESYKENLRLAEEKLMQASSREALDLGGILQNPALLNMATEMLSNPNMQNLISGLMTNTATSLGSDRMNVLLEASQALAQHMQAANPDFVDQLRRQVRPPGPGDEQPPSQ